MANYDIAKTHKQISLPKDTNPHRLTDMEWWYQYAFINGDKGGKYAIMLASYQAGELPVLKGHYLIFSFINLNNYNTRSFSLLDKRLSKNAVFINIPLYLLQCPHDKNVLKLHGELLHGKLPPPHQWLCHTAVKKNPLSLLYGGSSIVFNDNKSGQFNVTVAGDGMEASLEFNPVKPVSLIGENGKPDRLYYYSFTRNQVKGYIKDGATKEYVTGDGWFDHQWGYTGSLLTKKGWDWFGLQLDDGRELLINEFCSIKTGKTFSPTANLIEQDGQLRFTRDLILQPSNFWQSPLTNTVYPLNWTITIPKFKIKINAAAVFPEQEMSVLGPLRAIWEGVCSVSGSETLQDNKNRPISGKGFLEMVGYANYKC